jgi:hypothetical protein
MTEAALSVRLFLGTIAVAAFALGVNQAGWRHRVLVGSLFGVSGLCVIAAIVYPTINVSWPNFTFSLTNIASNAWVWFGLVVFLALYVLIWPTRTRPEARQQIRFSAPQAHSVFPAPMVVPETAKQRIVVEVTPEYLMSMHVGHMHTEALRLMEPYLNKWVHLCVSVNNVRIEDWHSFVSALVGEKHDRDLMLFFEATWVDRLSVLKKGDRIKVLGRIDTVEAYQVVLKDCALED